MTASWRGDPSALALELVRDPGHDDRATSAPTRHCWSRVGEPRRRRRRAPRLSPPPCGTSTPGSPEERLLTEIVEFGEPLYHRLPRREIPNRHRRSSLPGGPRSCCMAGPDSIRPRRPELQTGCRTSSASLQMRSGARSSDGGCGTGCRCQSAPSSRGARSASEKPQSTSPRKPRPMCSA